MWKYVLALLIPVAAFGGGYYLASNKVVEVEKIVTKDKIVVQEKIVTRTIVRKPDGTVTETVKEEIRDTKEETIKKETEQSRGSSYADYRVGARYWVGSLSDVARPGYDRIGVSVGRRLVGPIWLDLEATKREAALGVSVTW